MRTLTAALALACTLALTGCTAGGGSDASNSPKPTAAPSASASTSPSAAPPTSATALTPVVPDPITDASATAESVRLADAIQALIPAADIVHVDDHSQLRDTGAGAPHFAIIRTITLTATTDAPATAEGMATSLVSSGWINLESSKDATSSLTALNSSADPATSWFAIVGSDVSDPKAPVISLQLQSPDIP